MLFNFVRTHDQALRVVVAIKFQLDDDTPIIRHVAKDLLDAFDNLLSQERQIVDCHLLTFVAPIVVNDPEVTCPKRILLAVLTEQRPYTLVDTFPIRLAAQSPIPTLLTHHCLAVRRTTGAGLGNAVQSGTEDLRASSQ